ncbi:MAG TPA: hypothetical protein HA263_10850 [Methanoregulaceae archaeon]|nr:hypothetical protein [Methanoregulaceae archaeon]
MHPRALLPALVLLAMLAVCAGCTGDPAAVTPTPSVRADTALIAPELLAAYVPPAPPGWRLMAPSSPLSLEEGGVPYVSVTASYISDGGPNGTVGPGADLTIQDTAGRSVGLRRLVDRLAAAPENGTAPARTTLGGQPAFMIGDGAVTGAYLVVADRYVVYLAVTEGTRADFDSFVAALDLEGLSGQR